MMFEETEPHGKKHQEFSAALNTEKSQNFQDHMFCVAAQINLLSLSVVKDELKNEVYAPLKNTSGAENNRAKKIIIRATLS